MLDCAISIDLDQPSVSFQLFFSENKWPPFVVSGGKSRWSNKGWLTMLVTLSELWRPFQVLWTVSLFVAYLKNTANIIYEVSYNSRTVICVQLFLLSYLTRSTVRRCWTSVSNVVLCEMQYWLTLHWRNTWVLSGTNEHHEMWYFCDMSVDKLSQSRERELRRALFSLKQMFQEDKDLVHEFVDCGGLDCLIAVGSVVDHNYQNYILRGIVSH